MNLLFRGVVLSLLFFPGFAAARQGTPCMPGMQMPGCPTTPSPQSPRLQPTQEQPNTEQSAQTTSPAENSGMQMGATGLMSMAGMQPQTFLQAIAHHATSGTSAEPNSTPTPMLMRQKGPWMLMFHSTVYIVGDDQTSPRGGDKFLSTNWFMPMAQRELGHGIFTVRAMLSLEPATITGRQYPLLFQQGETAYGKPIADGQHPHDLFMELAALYDFKLSRNALLSLYLAPVGDPAIGPTAYPHRASASEDPLAALGHHQEDSTHIADDVVTASAAYRIIRIEASGFHGREPGEDRWSIDQGALDSWSARLTIQPGKNWSAQYSYARISSPEALFPTENQERMTASLMYNRPIHDGNWASTLLWGRTRALPDDDIEDSYLLESTLRFRTRNYVWTRIESAERTNLLILGENPLPPGFVEQSIGRVEAYTFGYDRDVDLIPHLASAIGAQITPYGVPGILQPIYGAHPFGVAVFIRLRPFSGTER
jgi:hypothetical protein